MAENERSQNSFMRGIFECCKALELPIVTSIVALTLMHRYINFLGFHEIYKRNIIAIATVIFLSCKVDENTRTLREVLSVVRKYHNLTKTDWIDEDKVIKSLKKEVIIHEQYLLRAIQFKTHVDIPHKYLLNFARTLTLDARTVAIAWGILNDSYLNSRTLTYEPSVLCCSCIYIASQCSMVPYVITESRQGGESTASPPAEGTASVLSHTLPQQWWELFGVPSDQLWGCIDYLVGLQDSTSTLPTPPLV